jgi:uroporphyrinogen-III synthase
MKKQKGTNVVIIERPTQLVTLSRQQGGAAIILRFIDTLPAQSMQVSFSRSDLRDLIDALVAEYENFGKGS